MSMKRRPSGDTHSKLSNDRNAPERRREGILHQHGVMFLQGADRDAFVDAALNPPKPAERLVEALRRHRSLFG